jgi:hypothetical protein
MAQWEESKNRRTTGHVPGTTPWSRSMTTPSWADLTEEEEMSLGLAEMAQEQESKNRRTVGQVPDTASWPRKTTTPSWASGDLREEEEAGLAPPPPVGGDGSK